MAVTPFWPFEWWMDYYLWFNSMYYQCLTIFPAMYNYLFKARTLIHLFLKIIFFLQVLNATILVCAWLSMRSGPSYNHFNLNEEVNDPSEYNNEYGA